MKSPFDLNNPIVQKGVAIYKDKMFAALRVPARIEHAIVPIYHLTDTKKKYQNVPDQIGSGVVVRIKDHYFIFSASHVFEPLGEFRLLTGGGENDKIQILAGERFSSGKGKSGTHEDDPIDATVFHIQSPISEKFREIALTLDNFDLSSSREPGEVFIAAGYRAKATSQTYNSIRSKIEAFPSMEMPEDYYTQSKTNPRIHIVLACEDNVIQNGKWQLGPQLHGLSGGAIIKVDGISVYSSAPPKLEPAQLLTAITIQRKKQTSKQIGVLVGTRIAAHLNLIDIFLPHLFKD
jgi:hypothetical protein